MTDGKNDDDFELIHITGKVKPEHVKLRNIAHELVHDLDVPVVVVATVDRTGRCVTSTMLHCGVKNEDHAAIGAALADGLRACVEQIEGALVHGDAAPPPPRREAN